MDLDFLTSLVQDALTVLYNACASVGLPNYGIAIIVMTVILKVVTFPLTKKQIESTKAMARLQPKMKELQTKYKGDKMRLNEEMTRLYKAEGVNPFSGCLPLLVQMPILIGIFYGIQGYQYTGSANFLWMDSIAEADPTFILPVLSGLTTFIQSKMTMPDTSSTQNQVMLYGMPLFIGYISISFPGGLVLYWVVMNLLQIAQQFLMERCSSK